MAGERSPHAHPVFRRVGGSGWLALASDLEGLGRSLSRLGEYLLAHTDFTHEPRLVLGSQVNRGSVETFSRSLGTWLGSWAQGEPLGSVSLESWSRSGLTVLAGGSTGEWVAVLSSCPADDVLVEGSTVFAVGPAAAALGQWVFAVGADAPTAGLSWLPRAVILVDLEAAAAQGAVHAFLARELYSYAVCLPEEGALALGPDGEVEVWSQEAPTVILGAGWRQA